MHKYLKEHIHEEIDGAIDYLKKAIELKGTPNGCNFYRMSEMELEHANCMLKMFNGLKKSDDISEVEYGDMMKSILEVYSESMAKIEAMKKLYWA